MTHIVLNRREAFALAKRLIDALDSDSDYVNVKVETDRTDSNGQTIVDVSVDFGPGTTGRLDSYYS